eukprot:14639377-Alexandrium_andersonii.AAC.1
MKPPKVDLNNNSAPFPNQWAPRRLQRACPIQACPRPHRYPAGRLHPPPPLHPTLLAPPPVSVGVAASREASVAGTSGGAGQEGGNEAPAASDSCGVGVGCPSCG